MRTTQSRHWGHCSCGVRSAPRPPDVRAWPQPREVGRPFLPTPWCPVPPLRQLGGPPRADKVGEPRDCAIEALSGLALRAKGVSKAADPEAPAPVHVNSVHVCFPEVSLPFLPTQALVPVAAGLGEKGAGEGLRERAPSVVTLPSRRGGGRSAGLSGGWWTLSPWPRLWAPPPWVLCTQQEVSVCGTGPTPDGLLCPRPTSEPTVLPTRGAGAEAPGAAEGPAGTHS